MSVKRPQVALTKFKPITTSLMRYATGPYDKIDPKEQREVLEAKLEAHPDDVSSGSSVRQVFERSPAPPHEDDMLAGIKSDMATIKETFALNHVPRESLVLGAAGVLPYLATSLSTVYLAFDINHAKDHGAGYLFHPDTARELLTLLEPIQIGYGAVIISFLGAIHWGLEYAGYGGKHSYRRYAIGVVAPAVAWPTMLMPVEYALITQFLAFNFLYFTDTRAASRGWCPPWYGTYRFVLTFIVGASIVISLIGRGQIAAKTGNLPGPADKMKALRDSQWENLEKEEIERRKKLAADEEAAEEDGEEEEDDDSSDEGKKDDDDESEEKDEDGDKDEEKKDDKEDKKEKK